jgi:hypothetical protein
LFCLALLFLKHTAWVKTEEIKIKKRLILETKRLEMDKTHVERAAGRRKVVQGWEQQKSAMARKQQAELDALISTKQKKRQDGEERRKRTNEERRKQEEQEKAKAWAEKAARETRRAARLVEMRMSRENMQKLKSLDRESKMGRGGQKQQEEALARYRRDAEQKQQDIARRLAVYEKKQEEQQQRVERIMFTSSERAEQDREMLRIEQPVRDEDGGVQAIEDAGAHQDMDLSIRERIPSPPALDHSYESAPSADSTLNGSALDGFDSATCTDMNVPSAATKFIVAVAVAVAIEAAEHAAAVSVCAASAVHRTLLGQLAFGSHRGVRESTPTGMTTGVTGIDGEFDQPTAWSGYFSSAVVRAGRSGGQFARTVPSQPPTSGVVEMAWDKEMAALRQPTYILEAASSPLRKRRRHQRQRQSRQHRPTPSPPHVRYFSAAHDPHTATQRFVCKPFVSRLLFHRETGSPPSSVHQGPSTAPYTASSGGVYQLQYSKTPTRPQGPRRPQSNSPVGMKVAVQLRAESR